MGAPMYNYGTPSALTASVRPSDQDRKQLFFRSGARRLAARVDDDGKKLVVLSARGEFGFASGGIREHWNHLDRHTAACARYIGVARTDIHTIAIEYQEFGDEDTRAHGPMPRQRPSLLQVS